MAYAIIYTAQIKDKLDSITYKVDILQDGYGGGSSTITYMSPDPVRLKYRSAKGKDAYAIGSSLTFKFKSLPADNNKYDALFEGEEKEFKIKYYKGAVLIWEGYIQSDNLKRTYLDELYTITLNASDWISNLKDVEFRNGDTAYANEVEFLQVIKTCLVFTGIELDFYTQINTFETTYMTSTTDVLNNLFVNQSRFTNVKDGKTKYTSVYNVLIETLKPLNITLKQVNGRYHLINVYEIDSYYRVHAWADLSAGSRTATDHIINIDDSIFEVQNSLAKLKPELRVDIKRLANDTGGELIGDLDDFSGVGPWTINAPDGETHSADRINITDNDPENNGSYIKVTSSSQTGLTGRYMSIEFDSSFIDTTWYLPLRLGVKVTKPSSGASTFQTFADPETGHFQSPISDIFELDETGEYTIEINVSPDQKPGLAGILTFQNVRINAIIIDDTEFDRNYIGYIDQNGQVKEDELYFSDADTDTDKGGFKAYSSGYVKTVAWNRYSKTDGLTIQEIYTLNILKNRQDYKNFISINVIDNSFAINASSIIQIDSINHKIIEITTVYKKNIQELKIERIFESDPSYIFTTSTLTSISGERTDPYNPTGSSTDHSALSGLGDDDHTQYHNDARGDARYRQSSQNLDHGADLDGLGDDDHTQYHNDARGDTRYYVKSAIDAWQHHDLNGLGDDDHTQYHNDARGDTRYYVKASLYTKSESDAKYAILAAANTFTNTGANTFGGNVAISNKSSGFYLTRLSGPLTLKSFYYANSADTGDGDELYLAQKGGSPLHFKTNDNTRLTIDSSGNVKFTNDLSSPTFSSGFGGSGWKIDSSNNATFDNLTVRKSMKIYELEVSKIRSGNGSYWFSDGCKTQRVTGDATYHFIWLDEDDKANMVPFSANDIVRCQEWNFITGTLRYFEGRVGYIDQTRSVFGIYKTGFVGDTPIASDDIVRVGSTTDASRRGAVYITSNDDDSPYMDVINGLSTVGGSFTTKVRVGKLDGITDSDAGLSGSQTNYFGIYTDNGHFKGHIYSNSGTIAGWTLTSDVIRSSDSRIMMQKTQGFGVSKNALSESNILTGNDRVNMYYASSSDWGIVGYEGANQIFKLGDTNKIAGFTFDDDKLFSDTLIFYGATGDIQLKNTGGLIPEIYFEDSDSDRVLTIRGANKGAGNTAHIISPAGLTIRDTGVSSTLDLLAVGDIQITSSSGAVNSGSNITALDFLLSSDKRLKKNIKPFRTLQTLLKLEVVWFEWNAKSKRKGKDFGLIAQDVEKVLPEVVSTDKDGYKAISYLRLSVLAIDGVKELHEKMLKQDKKIERLEKLVNKLLNK